MIVSKSVYGSLTLRAYELIMQRLSPVEAWQRAVVGKEKSCPKSAFLGLCQFGWVKHVPTGSYLSSRAFLGPNKDYAIQAAEIVLTNPNVVYTPKELWIRSSTGLYNFPVNHNQQMNVVLALREAGLLVEGKNTVRLQSLKT